MIKLGEIDGKEYAVDFTDQVVFGSIAHHKEDKFSKKDGKDHKLIAKAGEPYLQNIKYPTTWGHAVDLFLKLREGHAVSKTEDVQPIEELVAILKASNVLREELINLFIGISK